MSLPVAVVVLMWPSWSDRKPMPRCRSSSTRPTGRRHQGPETVQVPDYQSVAGLEIFHAGVELRAPRLGPRGVIGEHWLAPRRGENIEPQLQVLRSSAYPGVADGPTYGSGLKKVIIELEKFRSQAIELCE